jgi:hypothetical protein
MVLAGVATGGPDQISKCDELGSRGGASTCQLHHKPREYFCQSYHAIGCAACSITGHNGEGHDTGLLAEMVGPLRVVLKQ